MPFAAFVRQRMQSGHHHLLQAKYPPAFESAGRSLMETGPPLIFGRPAAIMGERKVTFGPAAKDGEERLPGAAELSPERLRGSGHP